MQRKSAQENNFGFWGAGLARAFLFLIRDGSSANGSALIELVVHYNDL